MDKGKLLIGGLMGVIILIIGSFILSSVIMNTSTDINSTNNFSAVEYFTFDNSTPEATAISIARLNEGTTGFSDIIKVDNVHLTPDGNYWVVNLHQGFSNWIVTINAKTLMSTKNGGDDPVNTWRSLDELKANYIAEIGSEGSENLGRPQNITLNGEPVWEIPVYDLDNGEKLNGYIYVDLVTGKRNYLEASTGKMGSWETLKEIDDNTNAEHNLKHEKPYRDALRDLYQSKT